MGMALGRTPVDEYKPGLSELGKVRCILSLDARHRSLPHRLQRVYGNVGLFFTNTPPQEVIECLTTSKSTISHERKP